MPPKGRKPKKTAKRTTKKYAGKYSKTQRMNIASAIPDKKTVVFRYMSNHRLDTAGSGNPAFFVYRGNSPHDPEYSSVLNHQPMFWDEISPQYQHYYCWKSRIVVKAVGQVADPRPGASNATLFTLTPTRQSATSANILATMERPKSKYRLLSPYGDSYRIENSAWTKNMLPPDNHNNIALVGGNPADMWFWHISAEGVNQTEAIVDICVEVYYFVTFYERNIQSLS